MGLKSHVLFINKYEIGSLDNPRELLETILYNVCVDDGAYWSSHAIVGFMVGATKMVYDVCKYELENNEHLDMKERTKLTRFVNSSYDLVKNFPLLFNESHDSHTLQKVQKQMYELILRLGGMPEIRTY